MPKDWPTGYLGINTRGPGEKPPLDYKTEVFELNVRLRDKAYALSRQAELTESTESKACARPTTTPRPTSRRW